VAEEWLYERWIVVRALFRWFIRHVVPNMRAVPARARRFRSCRRSVGALSRHEAHGRHVLFFPNMPIIYRSIAKPRIIKRQGVDRRPLKRSAD